MEIGREKLSENKTVLLRDRKRRTAHRVSSRGEVLLGGGGGYPEVLSTDHGVPPPRKDLGPKKDHGITPPKGTGDQTRSAPLPCGQTHTCENIISHCTSYAGGNNTKKNFILLALPCMS